MTTGFLIPDDASRARLMAAPSSVVLIGGFDGSANFGDLLQARVGIERTLAANRFAVVALVVEEAFVNHALVALGAPADLVILQYTDSPARAALTQLPDLTLTYLYGGGYLNEAWSKRRLRHFDTVASLVSAHGNGGTPRVAATGLQVSPHDRLWEWKEWLAAADPLRVRDEASAIALSDAGVPRAQIQTSADDAIAGLVASGLRTDGDLKCINIHLSISDYATDDAEARLTWMLDALATLAQSTPQLRCKLIVAFDDPRVSERDALNELERRYCERAESGATPAIEFETVSLVDSLAAGNDLVLGAGGTITSSYHVGLASLWAQIPTLLLADNDFYRQKMGALAASFVLPCEAIVSTTASPSCSVAMVLADVRTSLAISHESAVALMRAQADGADHAVSSAIIRLDRDLMWHDTMSVFPHYRVLCEEVADLQERKQYLELHIDELRAKLTTVQAQNAAE